MRLDDKVIIPYDRDAILISKDEDHAALADYLRGVIKQLRHTYFEIATIVNINDTPPVLTKTANYTATKDDKVILVDATSGAVTITLPVAALSKSIIYDIKKIDSSTNVVTVDADGSETIDGATTQTLEFQHTNIRIACNGTAWFIINDYIKGSGWEDILFPGLSLGRPAAGSPTLTNFRNGLELFAFGGASGVDEAFFTIHIPHDYLPGSKVYPHVHWAHIIGSPSGDVKWQIEYSPSEGHSVNTFPASTTVAMIQTAGAQYEHHIIEFTDGQAFTTNLEPDSVIIGRIFRDADDGEDTFANDAYLLHIDLHYQVDMRKTNEKVSPFTKN